MITRIINKLLGKDKATGAARKPSFGKRVDIGPEQHRINPELVDERAIHVVQTLQRAGYEAYIVGGAVRDLLVGLRPKDFDVATNATPEQVKGLFRRAFIIGRRFRIVHVVHGRGREHEVIEVSTFRAHLDSALAEQVSGNERTSKAELAGMQHAVDASGRVLRDNVWGPQIEDAARRDFTINAMYYDPQAQRVVDYHGGFKDVQSRTIRMIGDPATRYREDPVRIIRAVRFAAKLAGLGFKLDKKTAAPMLTSLPLLGDVPQSRLFDEMLKLLQTGHALASIEQLRLHKLERGIYPLLDLVVERSASPLVQTALQDTDRRVGEGKPVAASFLLACVLWEDVYKGWQKRIKQGEHSHPALQEAMDKVFDARIGDVSGRGKLGGDMREIWAMQPRFDKRVGSAPYGLLEQPRFRAAFDFMRLRSDIGEVDVELADWWQTFSTADDSTRQDMVDAVRAAQQQTRSRSRKPAAKSADSSPAAKAPEEQVHGQDDDSTTEAITEESGSNPGRRRRRRRRTGGAGRRAEGGSGGSETGAQ
ncbi:polynucleotide adenylyltransferase PcnB [Curvibacter sp. CHRR-16]|uniref:polynucleotide adenylyltransferase PcnB n=1 Tax=Curvibacter sp. CHRR-16 TaxID=2835872 RepID=UPI001BD91E1F|nr:polynucleotide adenylyltransferase PcnB [Curvibacter sp. CHRR-16]MBT0569175.1 polynucleotide adenylyltransferase PcnB [Curvibacter sp. CHRR-16]